MTASGYIRGYSVIGVKKVSSIIMAGRGSRVTISGSGKEGCLRGVILREMYAPS